MVLALLPCRAALPAAAHQSRVREPHRRMRESRCSISALSRRCRRCTCSSPMVSATICTSVVITSSSSQARSCTMSFTDARSSATAPMSAASPPGLSETTTEKCTRRRSAARPRSMTRPNVVMSMLPPERTTATRFPFSSGRCPVTSAPTAVAPPPSVTTFSSSMSRSTPRPMSFSLMVMTLSTYLRARANACGPTLSTARPSAKVLPLGSTQMGAPLCRAAEKEATRAGSTPMTCTSGLTALMASAMPAMRPPPPTGMTTASSSSTCSRISMPTVPAPAKMGGSSYPLMYVSESASRSSHALANASVKFLPDSTTLAPSASQRLILVSGAVSGMTTVTGIFRLRPW
mmetsp:Transcript_39458/g.100005  ORF Transcript_39458/g.100005 Transcript_39458/m.100005 type:complete len:347 (-) Transcript_39458:909-1949(-)